MSIKKDSKTKRYYTRFRDSQGKQRYFAKKADFPNGMTRAEAQRKEVELMDIVEQAISGTCPTNIDSMLDYWFENHIVAGGKVGAKEYKSHLDAIRPFTQGKSLEDIPHVAELIVSDHQKRGLANATIHQRLNPLKQIAKRARKLRMTTEDLSDLIETPKGRKKNTTHLSLEEVEVLANHAPTQLTADLIIFFAHTGIRLAEASRLQEGDIWDGMLTIISDRGTVGKSKKTRRVALSKRAIEVAARINLPIEISKRTMHQHLKKARDDSGIKMDGWHTLRHTFASLYINDSNNTMFELQNLLGHGTMDMTNRYAHGDDAIAEKSASTFDRLSSVK